MFYANRLRPPNVPGDGDYTGRPISVSVLGIAPTESVPELVDATIAVLTGRLAEHLPVEWHTNQLSALVVGTAPDNVAKLGERFQ